jgi:hypothetical protein
MGITSTAFSDHGAIPTLSPLPVCIDVPPDAKSLTLIIDDPDAPDPSAPKMTWVHGILYNLPPADGALPERGSE